MNRDLVRYIYEKLDGRLLWITVISMVSAVFFVIAGLFNVHYGWLILGAVPCILIMVLTLIAARALWDLGDVLDLEKDKP